MVKNTGIPENQLSNLDFGGVLRDSHNVPLHALDVNQINSLVPSSYQKVTINRDASNCNRISSVEFYGLGKQEIQEIQVRENIQGTAEITTFSFIGKTAVELDQTYAIIYDEVGSVGMLFRLDGGSTGTSGADRDIIIDIATGDSSTVLASKASSVMGTDSKFSSSALSGLCIVQSSTVGNKTDANSGDSGIGISVTNGVDSLKEKLFYVYKYDDSEKYAFYYTIDGSGSEPSHSGVSITAIDISSSDGSGQVAEKTAAIVTLNNYFVSTVNGVKFDITWNNNGDTTGFEDSNTDFIKAVIQPGEDLVNVATILLEYGECGELIGVERV